MRTERFPGGRPTARIAGAAILAVAALLRLYGLDRESLWYDELFVQHVVELEGLETVVRVGASEDVHPPGFPLFIHFWCKLFGDSEVALRLPTALAGVVGVWAVGRLGQLWFSTRVGSIAAALAAVNGFALYYSQECRAYSFLFCFSSLLVLQTLSTGRWRWFGFGMLALACMYLHYFGLLFVALLGTVLAVRAAHKQLPWKTLLITYAVLALAYLPWVHVLLTQVGRGKIWIPQLTPERVIQVYEAMTDGHLTWFAGFVLMAFALAAKRERRTLLLLLAWATVPTLAAIVVSALTIPVVTDRNLIVVTPALILLSAFGLSALERRFFSARPLASLAVVSFLLFELVAVRRYYQTATKPQFREVAARLIEESRNRDERPFLVADVWYASYFDYYFRRFGSSLRIGVIPRTDDVAAVVRRRDPDVLWSIEPRPRLAYARYREAGRFSALGLVARRFVR